MLFSGFCSSERPSIYFGHYGSERRAVYSKMKDMFFVDVLAAVKDVGCVA